MEGGHGADGEHMSKRILILYTGGTIGCGGMPLRPMSGGEFEQLLRGCAAEWPEADWELDSFDTPLDSASMQPAHWVRIAQHIIDAYADYDGFVILHGTDTMAWSAAALSFLLLGLDKPVVLTGAQRPLSQAGTDAAANLGLAVQCAVELMVPEVCIAFGGVLLRGNRAIKMHASDDAAFSSPDYPPLARSAGGALIANAAAWLPPPPAGLALSDRTVRAMAHERLRQIEVGLTEASVIVLSLFPGVSAGMLRTVLSHTRPAVRGLVLSAYGAGNAPDSETLVEELASARRAGVTTVVVTQTRGGSVRLGHYATGAGLLRAGAVSGSDMTAETALAKLVFLVAQQLPQPDIEQALRRSLAGEMSPPAT